MVYFESSSRNIPGKAQHITEKLKLVGKKSKLESFLGTFAKLWKATISFILHTRKSVCTHETTRLSLDGFSLNLIFVYFSNIGREKASFIKIR